jgi:hypothetical protein
MTKERGQEGGMHLVFVRTVEIDVQFCPRLFIDVFQCQPTKKIHGRCSSEAYAVYPLFKFILLDALKGDFK